jgi:hypothetical protein
VIVSKVLEVMGSSLAEVAREDAKAFRPPVIRSLFSDGPLYSGLRQKIAFDNDYLLFLAV